MISNPFAIILTLLSIELVILYLSSHSRFSKFFNIVPSVFWIYFLPMLASTLGLIDSQAPIYSKITTYLLPMSLFLLLMTVDIKGILRLGPMALFMFFIGSFGIVLGIIIVFALFKIIIGSQFWPGFAALSGSWTGGSANMIAVKEALKTPDAVFLPMVIVDTVVPYVWMAIMVCCVGQTSKFDQWNRSDRSVMNELKHSIKDLPSKDIKKLTASSAVLLCLLGIAGGSFSIMISKFLPEIKGVISSYAWTVIVVSCFGIVLSLTPVRKLEKYGTNKVGYFILYFVLASIGAKASITHISAALILIVAGFLVVMIHAIILLFAARLVRAPLFLVVVASQANIGGVASAPLVAEIYQKGFASVGLLLAILGNIEGTYIGIITGQVLHWIAG